MQPSKWEVWPWNWRKVRKAQISKPDRDLFERYGEAVIVNILAGADPGTDELVRAFLHEEDKIRARDWLIECRDSQHRREQRLETIEIGVVALITVEILLSLIFGAIGIYEAWKQGKVLDHMDASTAASAETTQTVRDELKSLVADQAKTREILQQQESDRAKKPRLALYLGNTPIDSASVHLKLTGSSHDIASLDLLLRNGGDAPVSSSRLHALTPEGVWLDNPINTNVVRQVEPEASGFTVQLPLLPAGQRVRVFMQLSVPHGHVTFKIPFTVDAMELQSVVRLGSLTVLPPKS